MVIVKAFRKVFRNLNAGAEFTPGAGLEFWRERIYNSMVSAMLVWGLLALIPSVWLSFTSGLFGLGLFDLFAYIFLIGLYLLRGMAPYSLRALLLILLGLSVGVVVFFATGDEGAGLFWMFAVPPFASLLLGLPWGLFFSALNIAMFVGLGYLVFTGSSAIPGIQNLSFGGWAVYGINFLAANAIVTVPLGALLEGLFRSSERQQVLEQDYQLLFNNNPLPMWVYDVESLRFLAVNQAAVDHYGYTREEFLGLTIRDIRPPEEIPALEQNLEGTVGKARQHSGPWKHLKKDGIVIDVEIYSHSLRFADRDARLVLANDVTEQLRAQSQLRLSDQILRRVKSLVLVMDKEGKIIFASPASEEIIGYRPEELLGDGWWAVSRADPKLSVHEKESLKRIATGMDSISPVPYERPIRARDGVIRWIEWHDALGPNNTIIGVGHDVTENKRLHQRTEKQLGQFKALSEIDRAILSNLDLQYNLRLLVDNVVKQLGVDAANVMLFDPVLQTLQSVQGAGFRTEAFERKVVGLGEGYAGKAAAERKIMHIDPLQALRDNPRLAKALIGEGFTSYYAVPLIAKGELRGVLEVFHRSPLSADEEWLDLLKALAGRAALAIDTIKVLENLERSNQDLILSYDATIEGWSRALDLRDKETEGHSKRVTDLGMELGRRMGLGFRQLMNFRRGALLHDIGKMGVPDTILFKPDKLTEGEWAVMKQHPVFAYEMLLDIDYLRNALDIPYAHHERWDGSGYPQTLKGEEIPIAARIFAVADVYDALTSDRPYRRAWTKEQAVTYIRDQAAKQFDPKVVEVFLKYHLATKTLQADEGAML